MFLNFIGSGSALNTALGNNSAIIKKGESLLLLDCGSTTFSRMQSLSLLDNIKNIFVLITHRHPDHISSLGDLIFYSHFILHADITILTPDGINVAKLLEYMGVQQELYSLVNLTDVYDLRNSDFDVDISYTEVQHVADMSCYGYIIKYNAINIFYSGDAKTIPSSILQLFENNELDYIYQDVCSYDYPDNPHMHIEKLEKLIDKEKRHRIFCMHYDENFNRTQALQKGFKLIENIE